MRTSEAIENLKQAILTLEKQIILQELPEDIARERIERHENRILELSKTLVRDN